MALLKLELNNKLLTENWLDTRAIFEEEWIVSFKRNSDNYGRLNSLIQDEFVAHLLKVHRECCATCPAPSHGSHARRKPANKGAVPAGGAEDRASARTTHGLPTHCSQLMCDSTPTQKSDGLAGLGTRAEDDGSNKNSRQNQASTQNPLISSPNEAGMDNAAASSDLTGSHTTFIKREVLDDQYPAGQCLGNPLHISRTEMQPQSDAGQHPGLFLRYGEYFKDKVKSEAGTDGSKIEEFSLPRQEGEFTTFSREPIGSGQQPPSGADISMEFSINHDTSLRPDGKSSSHGRSVEVEGITEKSGLRSLEEGHNLLPSSSGGVTGSVTLQGPQVMMEDKAELAPSSPGGLPRGVTPRGPQGMRNSVMAADTFNSAENTSSPSIPHNEGSFDQSDAQGQRMNRMEACHSPTTLERLGNQGGNEYNFKTHREKGFYICTICGKNFTKNENLDVHMRIHTGEKPYECSSCGKKFRHNQSLNDHLRTHTGELFLCPICGKTFIKNDNLNVHMRIHTGQKPFDCSLCGKKYCTRQGLNEHVRTHTGEKFPCSVCDKKFTQKASLTEHLKIHTGEKPYECSYCGKKFRQNQVLNVHLRTHTGEKFPCTICGKQFTQKGTLNEHLRNHAREKIFECEVCKKTFTQKRTLKVHMRFHSGDMPYHCSVCDKRFTEKTILTRHLRTHSGEKPFQCSVCEKRFTGKQQLTRHSQTHAGDKPLLQSAGS